MARCVLECPAHMLLLPTHRKFHCPDCAVAYTHNELHVSSTFHEREHPLGCMLV